MKPVSIVLSVLLALPPLVVSTVQAKSQTGHCPPGLAKKNPPCIPPGQAKKHAQHHHVGDYLPYGAYDRVYDHYRYRLPRLRPGEVYYRIGDSIVRIDRETREILQLIEAIASVTN